MKKRGNQSILEFITEIIIAVAIVHTSIHLALYGTGIAGFGEGGVSGFAIGSVSTDDVKSTLETKYPKLPSISQIIIISEWIALVLVLSAGFVIEKTAIKRATPVPIEIKAQVRGKSRTDLDTLFELLKEKKRLKLAAIAVSFHLSEENALEWAKILESANLATISYPRFGDPELVLNEIEEKQAA